MAALWAGAAHPRRQKHREMPPPGASAPAFAATVEPARARPMQITSKARRVLRRAMERVTGDVLLHASILDFKPKLGNRCKLFHDYTLLRASILDFKPRLGNRCKETLKNSPKAASILDFKPKLGNRCKLFPDYTLLRASILDFNPRLGNRCSTIVVAVENGPPATAVAATIFRVRFKFLCSKEEWPACSGRSGNEFRGRF